MGRFGFLLALAVAGGAPAANAVTLDFSFSFTNVGYDNAVVTGVVRGLAANGVSAASSVEVTSNSLGYGLGEYIGSPLVNQFTLSKGKIEDFNFSSVGSLNQLPAVYCCSLALEGWAAIVDNSNAAYASYGTGIAFTPLATAEPLPTPAPIPLPASGLMIVAGLAALGGAGSWRRAAPAPKAPR